MGDSLRGMGFTEIYYLGDSGGNLRGMQAAADASTPSTTAIPAVFHHVREFYNHDQVRKYIQEDLGIPEQIEYTASRGSDGIHDELSISSIMSVVDPTTVRYEQRRAAGLASINGISIEPLAETQDASSSTAPASPLTPSRRSAPIAGSEIRAGPVEPDRLGGRPVDQRVASERLSTPSRR
jgi:creatinine amidohydrolase